jgi:glucose/arabinose dehydrogenase
MRAEQQQRSGSTVRATWFVLAACMSVSGSALAQRSLPFMMTEVADFESPWALEFLPDGRLLVTEQRGKLLLVADGGDTVTEVSGIPEVSFAGQGGLGDVVLHPDFARNGLVYLSYAEAGEKGTRGAAVARARLMLDANHGALEDLEVIWRQVPKVEGAGHYGHRIAFGPDGLLWISSGERQKFDPAQDMQANLGKVIRLNADGSVPADNPFIAQGGVTAQIWSLGHRNPLGIAFDSAGRLWEIEMGPMGGDELNLIKRGENYGYPIVSNGDHYDGTPIPDHSTRPEFEAPVVFWNPVISPSSLLIYSGTEFPDWQGDAFVGGLSSESIVRIEFDGERAREAERFEMGMRIRAVDQGPDGAIWILEGGRAGRGGNGRMFRLTARAP